MDISWAMLEVPREAYIASHNTRIATSRMASGYDEIERRYCASIAERRIAVPWDALEIERR